MKADYCFTKEGHDGENCAECKARDAEWKERRDRSRKRPPADFYVPPAGLRQITWMRPAFDKRSDDPEKDYGIGCVTMAMVLAGPEVAVHFVFGTGIHLKDVHDNWLFRPGTSLETAKIVSRGMGYDLGYCDVRPHYKGQEVTQDCCDYLRKPCYTDGSALAAGEMFELLTREGDMAVWKALEERYRSEMEGR